jgi:alpha-D-ribose 1-methylphosphonate 5-triphosphate synthase subunit PhnI
MRIGLRSLVDAILGRIPGRTSRPDTATRMMIDADFSLSRESRPPGTPRERERDDGHLIKLADILLLEELVQIVNEQQERDAEDAARLYRPIPRAWPSFSQRERLDPGSRF